MEQTKILVIRLQLPITTHTWMINQFFLSLAGLSAHFTSSQSAKKIINQLVYCATESNTVQFQRQTYSASLKTQIVQMKTINRCSPTFLQIRTNLYRLVQQSCDCNVVLQSRRFIIIFEMIISLRLRLKLNALKYGGRIVRKICVTKEDEKHKQTKSKMRLNTRVGWNWLIDETMVVV